MTAHLIINVLTPDSLTLETYTNYLTTFEKVTLYSFSEEFALPFEAPILFGCTKEQIAEQLEFEKITEKHSYEIYINSFETLSNTSINNLLTLIDKIHKYNYQLIYVPVSYVFNDVFINNKELRIVRSSYPTPINIQDVSNLISEPIKPVLASNIIVQNNEPLHNKEMLEKRLKKTYKKIRAIKDPTAEQLYNVARYLFVKGEFTPLKDLIESHSYVLKSSEFTDDFFKLLFFALKKTKGKEVFEVSSYLIQEYNKDPRYLMYLANLYLELGFEEDYMPRALRSFTLPVPNESELIYNELSLNLPRFIDISLSRGEYMNVFEVVSRYLKLGLVDRETFKVFLNFQLQSIEDNLALTQLILKFTDSPEDCVPFFIDYRLTKGLKDNFDKSNLTDLQLSLWSYWRFDKTIFKKAFNSLPKDEQERVVIGAAVYDYTSNNTNIHFRFNRLYKTVSSILKKDIQYINNLKSSQIATLVEELVLFRKFELVEDIVSKSDIFSTTTVELLKDVFTKYHLPHAELSCLQILLNVYPEKLSYWLRAGTLLYNDNRFEEAINFLEVARKLSKKSHKVVELLILSYEHLNRHSEAKQLALSLPKENIISNFIYHRQI